jgi:tetratricopeptide (TPR) repeat protein
MRIFRIAGLLLAAVVAAASAATPATAQQIDITSTQNRYTQLYAQGKYAAALVYNRQGLYNEAETHFKRAVAMEQRALGRSRPTVLEALQNLAAFYKSKGKFAEG